MSRTKQMMSGTLAVLLFVLVIVSSLWAADYLRAHTELQTSIAQFGYPGIILIAIVAGLNVIIPFPAASLVPLFTTSGLYLPFIIISLTTGTVIADYIGYRFGNLSSGYVKSKYPKTVTTLESIYTERRHLIIPAIFIYAAFIPFPNEVLILPLAILGMPFRLLLLPLILGNLANQTMYAVGIQNIFTWWF